MNCGYCKGFYASLVITTLLRDLEQLNVRGVLYNNLDGCAVTNGDLSQTTAEYNTYHSTTPSTTPHKLCFLE